ncbi:MAG: sigma-54 dependent transcriptional regulator [Bdellovibrionales bacterium]
MDTEYISEGDWITIDNTHFIVSKNRDHHLITTPINTFNSEWSKQLKTLPFIAQSDQPLLILGESGTGKEVLYNCIHTYSDRSNHPTLAVNCGALSESLVESELFGHKKGAFTGAHLDRKGAFESAKNGTLFLDEIGDLPLTLQPALLRALENKQIRPLGADYTIKTNARIIAATHQNLKNQIRLKKFRQDLYYRLSVVTLIPPPLRDRKEDFDNLLSYFCKLNGVSFSFSSIQYLKNHDWPGNIRELKNVVLRAKALYPTQQINEFMVAELVDKMDTQEISMHRIDPTAEGSPVDYTIDELKKGIIISKLMTNAGNQRKTARQLGMAKSTLNDQIKYYNIDIKKLIHPKNE